MSSSALPLHKLLSGSQAFYKQPDYIAKTETSLASSKAIKTLRYVYNTPDTDHKIIKVCKSVFIIILFPLSFIHKLAGRIIIPASRLSRTSAKAERQNLIRLTNPPGFWNNLWKRDLKILRFTLSVDGYDVDVMIAGRASNLDNKRWMLASNGNSENYENKLDHDMLELMDKTRTNGIFFNYPGVVGSSGMIDRKACSNAYKAVLRLLEDKTNGIGANKIVLGPSFSIGGGVKGDALNTHCLKGKIKYVSISDKTFANLSITVNTLICRPLGHLVTLLGWNISSVQSSKNLKCPEIIIQRAHVRKYTDLLKHPARLVHDGVISAKASLAYHLMNDPSFHKHNKCFIGVPDRHNDGISDVAYVANKINEYLDGPSIFTTIQRLFVA